MNEDHAVLAVEDDWTRAEVARDEATLRRILDDRFTFNSSDGTTSGKEDLIRKRGGAWRALALHMSKRVAP
jgi:hypothetical protein